MRGEGSGRGEASAVAGSFGKDLMLETGGSGVLAAPLLRNGCELKAAISEPGRGLRFVFLSSATQGTGREAFHLFYYFC